MAPRESEPFLSFLTRRPVAIAMFMAAIAVFGFVSFGKLPMDLLPEISYPTLTVRTTYAGAAPEDVEDRVSVRLQESLSTLPGLVRSTSISRAETSDVVLEFEWGTEMSFAVQDVREKLDSVFLPNGAERPLILRYDPNLDPILRIGVTLSENRRVAEPGSEAWTRDMVQLRWLAENKIKHEFESLKGVAAIQVRGGLEEEIRIEVDPDRMAALDIDPTLLASRLADENLNASGGMIREGSTEYLVRTLNEFEDVEEIANLPVLRRNGGTIRVRDVAAVTRTHAEREVVTRLDGREAVEIAIFREAGANIVDVADSVKAKLFGTPEQQARANALAAHHGGWSADFQESWDDRKKTDFLAWRIRKDARVQELSDQSTFIRAAVEDVRSAAIIGALLAVLVIWIFLRTLSATLIIATAIPISVVVTFAPMFLSDVSLNIMSLGGLALGVGMLVDNAIVVLESISRCREEGDPISKAAVRGVTEVAGAITASTLTTIAVFAPIVFVHGIAGQIFGDQATTVVSSLLVSLLVAVLFIPMLASRRIATGGTEAEKPPKLTSGTQASLSGAVPSLLTIKGRLLLGVSSLLLRLLLGLGLVLHRVGAIVLWPVRFVFDTAYGALERLYPIVLKASLRLSLVVVALSGLLLWDAGRRIRDLDVELLPEIHQGEFTAHVGLEVGTPLEVTDRVLDELQREVRALEGVASTALIVGVEKDTLSIDIEGKHTARLTVKLTPEHSGIEAEALVQAEVERLLGTHPAVATEPKIKRPTPFALDAPVAVEVLGYDLQEIGDVAADVVARLEAVPELTNVRSTVREGHPEARVAFDRDKLLEFGLDLGAVSNLVRDQVLGTVPTRLSEGDERIDIRVLGDTLVYSNLDRVLDMIVNPGQPEPVRLRSIARVERIQGPAEIRRIGNSRAVIVTATGEGLHLGNLSARIEQALEGLEHGDNVTVQLGGQKREMDEAQSSMRQALLLAIFLVYVVMASQFESLIQPLVILVSVPLAGVGVVHTLQQLGIPLSVVVFIGLIMLAGIVVNNAIVLIDRINQRRAQGMELHTAILEAGRTRLRPILMTTATTVLGLLPLTGWLEGIPLVGTIGAGEGSEIRAPMAISVIAGLCSSTVLTLIVIPVIYSLVTRRTPPAQASA